MRFESAARLRLALFFASLSGSMLLGEPSRAADEPVARESPWRSLFNGKDLAGWSTYLAAPAGSEEPLGLDRDPRGVFSVASVDSRPAIRISGEIYGALTTDDELGNFHLRLQYRWGEKRWPPRETVGRDTGILYCCVGPHGAGSGAWMLSVECNIMERGTTQWWSVAGSVIDVEGERVTPEMEPAVPYKMESPGEKIVLYKKGAPRIVGTYDGITPSIDAEKPRGEWNTVEVIFWAGNCIHILNGQVHMVLTNPRRIDGGEVQPLRSGKIQLQSEAAEVFYRAIEVRPISELPAELLPLVPSQAAGEEGFRPLFGKDARDGWTQCGPGGFTLEDGVATAHGGMGLWWHSKKEFANFILRGEFLQEDGVADSGIFVRFPDPGTDPWNAVRRGHEIEIGNPDDEKPTWRTGSIYPFHAPAKVPAKPRGEWNEYEITCIGHDYSVRINGELVNTWSDPDRRSLSGHIGIQNYDGGAPVRHRNLRIKELP